ncbi:MAG: hypothetical protein M1829_002376 [Trizodia sp. TS-e1964]|nr:MAG: hypothetical protein M1829_002376 [Trizodia sp. TS-e1964]
MAHPFSHYARTPHRPEKSGVGDSASQPSRHKRAIKWYIRFIVAAVLITCIIIWYSARTRQLDRIPFLKDTTVDYLAHFKGHSECNIRSHELYTPPPPDTPFCANRAKLLSALSSGGRHGFDQPFSPLGCAYRWYSTPELCMVLSRFGSVVLVGDERAAHIAMALQILAREDLALGALRAWEMGGEEQVACRCEDQFVRASCARFAVADSRDVGRGEGKSGFRGPLVCKGTPLVYLEATTSPAPAALVAALEALLRKDGDTYKPTPLVLSLSLSTALSRDVATGAMDEWAGLADASMRNVPFLWVGPVAAGHLKPPGQAMSQGNAAVWHYAKEMAGEAAARQMDVLDVYNMTLQAHSWNGSAYGLRVALVQAMMVSGLLLGPVRGNDADLRRLSIG